MTGTLAVFTNDLGASFIDLHVSDLAPGRTVAVGRYGPAELGNMWKTPCPELLLDRWSMRLPVRLAKRAGVSENRLREAAISRFLRRHQVGVVLGEYLDEFLSYVPLLERMGIPYVVQGHGVDVSAALRRPGVAQSYLAYRSARAVLTRSEFHRQRLIGIGLAADKVHVNRGGVDVPAEPPVRAASAGKRLLSVGRMAPKKGPFYLLEAFRRAAARDPDISLDYVGGGPFSWGMRQFIDACGLEGRIRLHGAAPETLKQSLLQECGVFVQHSLTNPENGDEEGLPAAIQEAMAAGMAVVATRHAGIPEAVIEGETGILVDEGDVEAMAQAFLDVGPRAAELGRAGHARALKHDAWPLERGRLKHWLFGEAVS
ncbi:MAG: glycosyltransferase [Deltaproteobacteria bacterium]|nr:glycosyltransferase [Deltaproteobacteria bacterium]